MTIDRPRALTPALALTVLLVACTSAGPSGSGSSAASATPTAEATATPASSDQPSLEPTPEPTDGLGRFACDFPVTGLGTVERAQITDVRVGTHDGYDRIVFEFESGIPQFTLEEATPPLLGDPSGMEIEVDGNAFWRLVLHGGTAQLPDGGASYNGPTDFTRNFPKLSELVSGGDFEAVSSWYIGLDDESCVRVLTLNEPSRLVIDIEQ